jgi:hypothetical protein
MIETASANHVIITNVKHLLDDYLIEPWGR